MYKNINEIPLRISSQIMNSFNRVDQKYICKKLSQVHTYRKYLQNFGTIADCRIDIGDSTSSTFKLLRTSKNPRSNWNIREETRENISSRTRAALKSPSKISDWSGSFPSDQSLVICQTTTWDAFPRTRQSSWRTERDERRPLLEVYDVTKSSSGAVFLSGHFVSNRTAA